MSVSEVKKPGVFVLAEPNIDYEGVHAFLNSLGVRKDYEWYKKDCPSDAECLLELAGRSCYKSFGTELNPNLTKVRELNGEYLEGILRSGHGSVLEHANVTFAFTNVSRVFTHELVRHRAGAAYSQESLRFVRLSDLTVVWPSDGLQEAVIERCNQMGYDDKKTNEVLDDIRMVWARTMSECSEAYSVIGSILDLDHCDNFTLKKRITSAMRRLAPIGLATMIVATYNMRSLRHIIAMRTSPGAEEEIKRVFIEVAKICRERWPHIFQDMRFESGSAIFEYGRV